MPQDISFCRQVTRDPRTAAVSQVVDVYANVAAVTTQGIDVGARYALPTDAGRFTLRFDGTYLLAVRFHGSDGVGDPRRRQLRRTGSQLASGSTNLNPRVKFNAGVSYDLGAVSRPASSGTSSGR